MTSRTTQCIETTRLVEVDDDCVFGQIGGGYLLVYVSPDGELQVSRASALNEEDFVLGSIYTLRFV